MKITSPRIITFLLLLWTSTFFAEGWTKKAGTGYYALDFRFLSSTKYHNSAGDNVDINRINDLALNFYGEYGITDNLTVKLNFPFYKILDSEVSSDNNAMPINPDNKGAGDFDFGLRYKIKSFGQTTLAASITLGIPVSTDDIYSKSDKFALSDGEFNQIIGFEVGHSLFPLPAYISGSVKFNNRNEGYSDQILAGIEGGYKLDKSLLLNLRLSFLKSLKNGDKIVYNDLIPIMANNQEFISLKFGAFYNFYKNIGFASTAVFGLAAKNVLSAPVFSVGIYIK
jgi:hypothetical protein